MDSYPHEIEKGKVRCVLQGPVAPEPNVSEEPMLQAIQTATSTNKNLR